MFPIGSKIVVLDVPYEDDGDWGIFSSMIGIKATVIPCDRDEYNWHKCFKIKIDVDQSKKYLDYFGSVWYFPSPDTEEFRDNYILFEQNRWNPMNYIPRTKPLKLP